MKRSRPFPELTCPTNQELDWFRNSGINVLALAVASAMLVTHGHLEHDGLFEPDPTGKRWFAFELPEAGDLVVWQPSTSTIASWTGRCFALGQEAIDSAATCSFDCNLNIFSNPMDWLRAKRDGIVVLPRKWPEAFDRLRHVPRVAIAESLLPLYRKHMRPARLPELFIIPEGRKAA